jgi:hypothetical protein
MTAAPAPGTATPSLQPLPSGHLEALVVLLSRLQHSASVEVGWVCLGAVGRPVSLPRAPHCTLHTAHCTLHTPALAGVATRAAGWARFLGPLGS